MGFCWPSTSDSVIDGVQVMNECILSSNIMFEVCNVTSNLK